MFSCSAYYVLFRPSKDVCRSLQLNNADEGLLNKRTTRSVRLNLIT